LRTGRATLSFEEETFEVTGGDRLDIHIARRFVDLDRARIHFWTRDPHTLQCKEPRRLFLERRHARSGIREVLTNKRWRAPHQMIANTLRVDRCVDDGRRRR
jgi:hypothetical protein